MLYKRVHFVLWAVHHYPVLFGPLSQAAQADFAATLGAECVKVGKNTNMLGICYNYRLVVCL